MTDEQIEALVAKASKEAASAAVREVFITLGVDITKPTEVQADMLHLRSWRLSSETIKRQGLMSAVAIITIGTLGLIWAAVTKAHP